MLKKNKFFKDSQNKMINKIKVRIWINYIEDLLYSKVLSDKNPLFIKFLDHAVREAVQNNILPLLIFMFDQNNLKIFFLLIIPELLKI